MKIRILEIAGSVRKDSYNRAALRATQKLAPGNAEIEIFELDGILPYNQDNEIEPPAADGRLKEKIRSSDAILFVTPDTTTLCPACYRTR